MIAKILAEQTVIRAVGRKEKFRGHRYCFYGINVYALGKPDFYTAAEEFFIPSNGLTVSHGQTAELPPPPVRATLAAGPMNAMVFNLSLDNGSRPSFFRSTMLF